MNSACGEGVQNADNFADADVIDERCNPQAQIKHFSTDLGCFSDVDIRIDTASGGGPADYEVTFQVTELGRARGTINTMVGNQEGSLLTGLAAPNLLGMRMRACLPALFQFNEVFRRQAGFRHLLTKSLERKTGVVVS